MPWENKPNTGSLFPNNRATSGRHPHFVGIVDFEGLPIEMSLWKRTAGEKSKNPGMTYFYVSLKRADPRRRQGQVGRVSVQPESQAQQTSQAAPNGHATASDQGETPWGDDDSF